MLVWMEGSVNGQAFLYSKIKLKKMEHYVSSYLLCFYVRVINMREILTIVSFW